MKKLKLLAILMVLFCGSTLSAKSFDWSECWCNYGGGIRKGDFIINVDTGLWYTDFAYTNYTGYWCFPPVMVEVQYAQPIWKLPFTFGGYAGLHAFGYKYWDGKNSAGRDIYKETAYWGLIFGTEAAYHIQLPPKGLDVYAVTRIGGTIPLKSPDYYWDAEYFHIGEAIGANWFFGDFFGVNLEFGYPFTKIGATFKF